ncbi:aquaporin [Jatrophihabitans sp. YIM 134969]
MEAVRRCLAEFLGTGLLVIGGVGVAVLAPEAGPLGIALAFGLTLLVLAYAIGPVSGCHINPAVTLGMTLTGRLNPVEAVGYIVAQVLGAIGGTAVVYAVASNRAGYTEATDGIGANGWGAASSGGYGQTAAIIVEVVLTFLLVYTVLTVTASTVNAATAGLPIGFALLVCHLVAVPIDGTSVNPARSIGPALFAGGDAISQLWVFLVFPLIGAVAAALVFRFLPKPVLGGADARHEDSTATPASSTPVAAAR